MALTLKKCIEKSLTAKKPKEYSCTLKLKEGKEYNAYSVSIANRDLLFYCEGATISYVVDLYDDRHVLSLVEICED